MAFPSLLCLLLIFSFSSSLILPSFSFSYTFELSPNIPTSHSFENPKDVISDIAKSTLDRAHHIKHLSKNPSASTPLFPRTIGIYTINLPLGTPQQNIPAFFDTGSSLVWVPCTSHYSCPNCTQNNAKITIFKPKRSSSKRSVSCSNKRCRWLDQPELMASCPGCNPGNCRTPCAYIQIYGAGQTSGHAISDTLNLQGKLVRDLFVGCSSMSEIMPQGIVGFGRNPMSLPNQLNLTKFSYCLVSHKFDNTPKNSKLILGDSRKISGIKYTPLIKNPPMLPFNQYFYVHLEKVTIGKKVVELPHEILSPDSNGNGGTIVDSGSTLTSLASTLFDPITKEFTAQMTPNQCSRVDIAHSSLGNVFCMNVTGGLNIDFPKMVFYFKGGVEMDLTVDNYYNGGQNLLCLPFLNTTMEVGLGGSGPAVILGNYQQQNFEMEYDLKNEKLGVKKQDCGRT